MMNAPRLALLMTTAAAGLAAEPFSNRLTPEERSRAGLGKLSPAELAALDALIGEHPPVRSESLKPASPAPPVSPAPRAEAPSVAPAAGQVTSTATRTAGTRQEKSSGGSLRQAQKATASQPEKSTAPAVETEIDGDFTGWGPLTTLTMKDGSVWRIDNLARPFYTSRIVNPRVRIYPAVLNGYWIEFVDLKTRVRVVRLK
jgi:hypothetical protein